MSLAAFILALCEIWSTPTGPLYVRHMREAPGGAEARAMALSRRFHEAARPGVSPLLLAAVAYRESGFKRDAIGKGRTKDRCVMGLNPRNAANRAALRGTESDCIHRGATILARELRRCGSISSALGAYNSGRCNGAPLYARRVLATLTGWP